MTIVTVARSHCSASLATIGHSPWSSMKMENYNHDHRTLSWLIHWTILLQSPHLVMSSTCDQRPTTLWLYPRPDQRWDVNCCTFRRLVRTQNHLPMTVQAVILLSTTIEHWNQPSISDWENLFIYGSMGFVFWYGSPVNDQHVSWYHEGFS